MKWFFLICGGVTIVAFLRGLFDKQFREVCPKHKVALKDGECAVTYGLIPMPYLKAKRDLFPWAHTFVLAGCVVPEPPEKTRKTRFCPACREAEQKWKEENAEI